MTNSTCAAASCSYNRRNVRKLKLDIVFHTFPRVPILRQKWIKFCARGADWTPKSNEAVCSVHFKDDDYQMAMSPLMRSASSFRRLNLSAVPTILKGSPIPIAKRKEMDEKVRQQLLDELYGKDAKVRDNDHSYDDIYNIDNIKQKQPKPFDKLVYRLLKYPDVCMLCLKEDNSEESTFSPLNSYNDDLECTMEQMYDEVVGEKTDHMEIRHLLPDKLCEECMEALITFYQYQKQLKCLKKFTVGMAHLIQGNKSTMQTLFGEQNTYLVGLLQSLKICEGTEDKITFERLEKEVTTYGPIAKHTLYEQANHEVEQIIPSIPIVESEHGYSYEELIEEEREVNSVSPPPVPIEPFYYDAPKKGGAARGRPRKRVLGAVTNANFMCPYLDVCKLWFADDATLQNHVQNDHKYFKCRTCGAKIKFYDLYKKHIESHAIARALLLCHNKKSSNQQRKCSICQKSFNSEELLRRHETTHSGERNFVCGTCLGVYLTNEDFRNHRCVLITKLSTSQNTIIEQTGD